MKLKSLASDISDVTEELESVKNAEKIGVLQIILWGVDIAEMRLHSKTAPLDS